MEKLELKHLAPYLPYKLNIVFTTSKGVKIHLMDSKNIMDLLTYTDNYKVKLRPLSELKNFENEIFNLYDVRNPNNMKDCLYDIQRVIENGIEFETCYAFVDWMFQKHFDVFGLIDKGLAISYSDVQSTSNEG